MSQLNSFGVTPLTAGGMQFPITAQATFGGPLTHYAQLSTQQTGTLGGNSNWGGGLPSTNPADDAAALATATLQQQVAKSLNANGLATQSLNLTHAASVVSSHSVGSGVVVAAATQGSITIVCAPHGPSNGTAARDQSPSPSSLLFRQGQVSQMTAGLPDVPTCITLFPLPFSAPRSVGSAASIPDPVIFTSGNTSSNAKQVFSSLGFNLCCAVGTSSGNIYIYDIVSRTGLPRDATVSAIPTCVNERSLREAVDGSFAPATHKAGCVITDVCGIYTNGIQMSILAIATSVSGVHFVRVSKSANGEDIVLNNTVASIFQSSNNKVVSVRAISQQNGNNNNNNTASDKSETNGVALYRRSSILTFAVNYDNGSIKMVDLRLFITPSSGTEPQVTPEVSQILDARESSRNPTIVCGDIFVSREQDVTSYSVEEGGSVVVNFIPSPNNNNTNQQNQRGVGNGLADSTSAANLPATTPVMNRESTGFSPNSGLGGAQPTTTSNFHAASSSNTATGGGSGGANSQVVTNNRIAVPRVNSLTCLSSSQAVASSRNSLLLLSASGNNLRARYNTQNLMTLPFVINDFSILKVNNSSFVSDNSKVSRMVNGTAEVGNSSTIAFVAADRNLFLIHVPQ